jgi:ATP synthase protein I
MVPSHRPIPESKQPGKTDGLFSAWVQAEKMMQIALVLPCATFIGWLAGVWLDRHFHQSWIALVGIVFGGASGLIYVVRLALAASKDPAMQDQAGNEPQKGSADKTS